MTLAIELEVLSHDLLICFRDLFINNRLVSSAKWWTLLLLMDTFKSFMKIMNKSGPNTDHLGIPYNTFSGLELLPFILVYWVLFTKNDLNQSLAIPCIPQWFNFERRILCGEFLLCQKLSSNQDKCHRHTNRNHRLL